MKHLGDMTIDEINKEIDATRAYMGMCSSMGPTWQGYRNDLHSLTQLKRELERQQRHTTPHNKTRLGSLWPVATTY